MAEREQLVQHVEEARLEAAAADKERCRLQALLAAQQPDSPLAQQELESPRRPRWALLWLSRAPLPQMPASLQDSAPHCNCAAC